MKANNRELKDWFSRIRTGQIRLPRFQRHESWSHNEVAGLLESVLGGLPTGAALTLEIGDEEPFISRPIVGAPEGTERVAEHLLDGQQRLTALWRSLHDNYPERTYLIGEETDEEGLVVPVVHGVKRLEKDGDMFPLWVDDPVECWVRGWIPAHLCNPDSPEDEADDWVDIAAPNDVRRVSRLIARYRTALSYANIPFLALPVGTSKATALDVFIKMNTSSVKLTAFDIIVAQYEAANDRSLHEQIRELTTSVPNVSKYRGVEDLLLDIAALREDRSPTQASYARLDLEQLADDFEDISNGVEFAVRFLESESIFDSARLPTVAVLPVLGALHAHLAKGGDELGNANSLIRSYLWRAFTTSRYDSSAGSRALQDFRGLVAAFDGGENTAPVFDVEEFPIPTSEELLVAKWPKTRDQLARSVLAASLRRGAFDLADGARATGVNMAQREYHHLFPDHYLTEAGVDRPHVYTALNCALITWVTNRKIGAKPPLVYLQERVDNATLGEDEIRRRLESHLIPWSEFVENAPDIKASYDKFLVARADIVCSYIEELCHGREPAT